MAHDVAVTQRVISTDGEVTGDVRPIVLLVASRNSYVVSAGACTLPAHRHG